MDVFGKWADGQLGYARRITLRKARSLFFTNLLLGTLGLIKGAIDMVANDASGTAMYTFAGTLLVFTGPYALVAGGLARERGETS